MLYLTPTGNKTGKRRTAPALYPLDEGRWIAFASNDGSDSEPGWWLNLRAGTPASVEIGDITTPALGTEVDGADRYRLWSALNKIAFRVIRPKVSRRNAVMALSPIG